MNARVFFSCLILLSVQAVAQDCSCKEVLDSLITKTESNYAGYVHKVKDANKEEPYRKFKKSLQARSSALSYLECYDVLSDYVRYFKDDHLFIAEFPNVTPKQRDSLSELHPKYTLTAAKKSSKKDLIEGTWQNADQQLEIVRVGNNKFYAVVVATSIPKWEPGMIRMEIQRTNDNEYAIRYYNNDFGFSRFQRINIYKRLMIGFGMQKFVKLDTANPEGKYVHLQQPEQPFFRIIDKDNILLTVPSALIDRKIVDSILMKHKDVILSTKNFILDLRSNRGGNFMWSGIYMLSNTKEYPDLKKKDDGDDFRMLASADNATYFNQYKNYVGKDSVGIAFYSDLNKKIKENIGKIIGFSFYQATADTARRMVFPQPVNVAVITDKGVASAAEAVIQYLKSNSKKLKLYGDNTSGMIDYANVNNIRFGPKANKRYIFGYPTFFSPQIVEHPINPTGIIPDKYIPKNVQDWIQWVIDDLKGM